MQKKRLKPPLLLGEAVQLLAKLGGHLGRKKDLPPGHQTMWRGYSALQFLCAGFLLLEDN